MLRCELLRLRFLKSSHESFHSIHESVRNTTLWLDAPKSRECCNKKLHLLLLSLLPGQYWLKRWPFSRETAWKVRIRLFSKIAVSRDGGKTKKAHVKHTHTHTCYIWKDNTQERSRRQTPPKLVKLFSLQSLSLPQAIPTRTIRVYAVCYKRIPDMCVI